MKRAFIIHGWGGNPDEGWFPWLKEKLKEKGFKVEVPLMPNTFHPKIKPWVKHLSNVIGTPDEETFLIGHSIGSQAILRYLEALPLNVKIGKVVFVAGFFNLKNLNSKEMAIALPWLKTPIDLDKVKNYSNFTAIFSSNNPDVPLKDKEIFKRKLNAQIILENRMGHFSGSDGIKKLPSALKAVLN